MAQNYKLENWKFWVEVATLCVIVLYTIVAYYQWTNSREQTRINVQALIATQRAYVNVQDVKVVSFEVGKTPEAMISYKNSGLTPAKSVLAIPSSFIREQKNGPPEPRTNKDAVVCVAPNTGIHYRARTEQGEVLPPGAVGKKSSIGESLGNDYTNPEIRDLGGFVTGPLTKDDLKAVQPFPIKKWYIVLYLSYYDQFGGCHSTDEPFEYNITDGSFHRARWGWKQVDEQYQPN